jgi:class 3 adenylate cyclase
MVAPVQFARTDDGRSIAYSGEGHGPTMVFARGWITHLELSTDDVRFASFMAALASHLHIVRYDGRGNGMSDRRVDEVVTLDQIVSDLAAVVERQEQPVILWGSSFAGPAAIRFAARNPEAVSCLILDGTYASGAELGTEETRQQFLASLEMARTQPDGLFAALSFLTDPEPGSGHDARIKRLRQSISPEAVIALYTALYDFDVTDDTASIAVPTLVLHRRGTRAIPYDRGRALASAIPGARLVTLEGRAHNPWEERPVQVLAAMGEFLGLGDALAQSLDVGRPVDDSLPMAVLFTDIVGSTAMTERLGDEEAQAVVRTHDRIVRALLAETRGREVKHTGDGIMASFPAVSAALSCAARIQQDVAAHNAASVSGESNPLHVKVGINAGEPLSEDDDLYGTVVQLAARMCDRAGPDEVLVTNIVRELAAGKGFDFADRGTTDLKGFEVPVHLWELTPEQ